MMKRILLFVAVACSCAYGQSALQRYDADIASISSISPPTLIANIPPNSPTLSVCSSPANAVPCTNYVSTFTASGAACLNGAQDTPQPATTSTCQPTGDAQGSIGFWIPAGKYDYTYCIQNNCFLRTITIGGSGSTVTLPFIIPTATGNGTTDDTAALNAATASCPQSGTTVGCLVYLPCGHFKTTATWNIALLKGIHIMGGGTDGTGGACSVIQTNGAIDGMTVGNGTTANSSGFQMDNVAFQDMTGNGLSGIHIKATRDALLTNIAAYNYTVGAGFQLDGGVNFTQFVTIDNPYTWQTKFGIQTVGKTASIYIHGGELNCQNSAGTDVISGSIGIDLGYTFNTAATGTASEWAVTTQTQNCQIGRALFNAGGNKFLGDKADEITINDRPGGSFGVLITGDTASLANGNSFVNEQVTRAGTGFYIAPFATNTIIDNPVFNGTNGVDFVIDAGAWATTKLTVVKPPAGWTTNLATLSANGTTGTLVTEAQCNSGDCALGNVNIFPGTFFTLTNVTGVTAFNNTFYAATVIPNDAAGTTTIIFPTTISGTGTINTGACGGLGSCITPISSVLNSGVAVIPIPGENITQNQTFQGVSNCPTLGLSGTATTCFDGTFFDVIQNNGGVLHAFRGPTIRNTGSTTQTYTPQPTTTAGYGLAGIPPCSALLVPNAQTPVPCPSSDDDGIEIATNTNGTTHCLPTPGAPSYPPNYRHCVAYAPGGGPNYLSVTPPGQTSLYGQQCGGASGPTLDESTAVRNLSSQNGFCYTTDGNNWFTIPGNPLVALDQIGPAISNKNLPFQGGSWAGGGAAGNNGATVTWGGGNSNDSTGSGGNFYVCGPGYGHDPASGKNGLCGMIMPAETGVSTTGKEGGIARFCNDFTADCSSSVLVKANAIRGTISDSGDVAGPIGIIFAGAAIGNTTDVQVSGIYPTAITENSCTQGQYFLVSQVSSSVNTRGYCSGNVAAGTGDGPLRVGFTTGATTGTCNTSSPCQVPVYILPAGNAAGSGGSFTAGGDLSGSNTSQEVTGILSHNLPTLAIGGLCWTGSALTWGSCSTSSITINNGTGITGGATGSTFTLSLTAPAVLNNQVNIFGSGFKQSFTQSSTTAGLRFVGTGSDPSIPAAGDEWYNTVLNFRRFYDGTLTHSYMWQDTPVTLGQLNNGSPANGQVPYVNSGAVNWLGIGATGCLLGVTGSGLPGWNSNVCYTGGGLVVNGPVTGTQFVGTGPYYLKTTYPSGSISPTSGQSVFGVSSDTNFYFCINGATCGQVPYFPTGQVASDQILTGGGSPGTFNVSTLTNCISSTCALGYNISTHSFTTNSVGGGTGVITGYCNASTASGANPMARIQTCLGTSGVVIADDSGDTCAPMTASLTMTSTTGQTVILPPCKIVEGSGNTVNISGNHNTLTCPIQQYRSCGLDGSTNGALGTVNITSGKDNHIIGISITGGSLTNQAGTEVTMSGAYHTFEHGSVDFAGSFGVSQSNCYRCKTIDSHFNHSVKAAWGVNTGTINLSAMSGSGTLATATTSAASLVGSTGNQMQVAVGACSDTTYNGQFQATSTGTTSFTYNTLTSVVSGSPTGCTYTVPSVGNEFLDNKGANNNTVDTGDAEVGITSSGGLGLTDGTIIRGNYFYNDLPVCNGDSTGATALAVTSVVISGTTATATVPINPNLITSPVASTVVISGATTTGGSINGNQTVVTASSTQFTFTTSVGSQTATGTITYVVAGHGTNAHGCSEMYQMTDKATATEFAGNEGLNSWREMFATSGTGNRIHDNKCVNPNAINGGNGCFMMSVTHNGGLETQGYFGDSTFTHNTALLNNSLTTPYCYSIQLGTGVTNIVAQNIVISDNVCDSIGGGSFAQGLRFYDPSTAGTVTVTNLDFHDNQILGATAPTQFSVTGAGVTVVGAPRSANNSTGVPTCTFTSGGGSSPSCALDAGSSDSWGIIVATTGTGSPAGTGTITLTFTVAQGYNKPSCTYTASDEGGTTWNGLAVIKDKTPSTASDLFTWTNGTTPTTLTASTAYWINYDCHAK